MPRILSIPTFLSETPATIDRDHPLRHRVRHRRGPHVAEAPGAERAGACTVLMVYC